MTEKITTINPKPENLQALLAQEFRLLRIEVALLKRQRRHQRGEAAHRAYEEGITAEIERKIKPSASNVVRFAKRRPRYGGNFGQEAG